MVKPAMMMDDRDGREFFSLITNSSKDDAVAVTDVGFHSLHRHHHCFVGVFDFFGVRIFFETTSYSNIPTVLLLRPFDRFWNE
jgi:hypothetical protein